jgi:hypothetical protein
MSDYKCTREQFLSDVQYHQMIIIKDDQDFRHIRFKRPDTRNHYFDLITWENMLCITGDMGTYVFSRNKDMFYFFVNEDDIKEKSLKINPFYWSEKVVSESIFGNGVKEFSVELYEENVKEDFENYCEYKNIVGIEKDALLEDIKWQLLLVDDEYECVTKMREFSHDKIKFDDFWEYDNTEYTFHYIWICYALVWGIKKYFREKK